MACKNCKNSILSSSSSIIPAPKCNGDCPEVYTCEDNILSDCIFYTGPEQTCIDVQQDDNLTIIIQKINAACANQQDVDGCSVKTSSTDACCGYLSDKIASDNLSVAEESYSCPTGGTGVKLKINTKQFSYVAPNLNSGWIAGGGGFQVVQYGTNGTGDIRLRGTAYTTSFTGSNTRIFTLPAGYRPTATRKFIVNSNNIGQEYGYPIFVEIRNNGEVHVDASPLTGIITIYFDGIFFENY